MINEKLIMKKVRDFIKFKRAISGGEKELAVQEEMDVFQEVVTRILEGETLEHALENGFNTHLRFIKAKGAIFVEGYFDDKVMYTKFEKLLAKDMRFISYKNFWRHFCEHEHSFQAILSILDGHMVSYRVVPSKSEKYKISVTILKDCPICGKFGDYQICMNEKGWYFGKCISTQSPARPANVGKALAIALEKPYPTIKDYIYNYLLDNYRSSH